MPKSFIALLALQFLIVGGDEVEVDVGGNVASSTPASVPGVQEQQNSSTLPVKEKSKFEFMAEKAVELAGHGDLQNALVAGEEALLLDESFMLHHLLSNIHSALDHFEDALFHIEEASRLNPQHSVMYDRIRHFLRGTIAIKRGKFYQALQQFKSSAELTHNMTEIPHLEKCIVGAAAAGDVIWATEQLYTIWKTMPMFPFHNGIPFVKMVEEVENRLFQAQHQGITVPRTVRQRLRNITQVTHYVYLDVQQGSAPVQRIVLGLYGIAAPRTVSNFLHMIECSIPALCLKHSPFHRVLKGFVLQGGDVQGGTGRGAANLFGRPFADEPLGLVLMHGRPGVLASANAGPDSNTGQFSIMTSAAPHLNGHQVVFGQVLEGMAAVSRLEQVAVDENNAPREAIIIVNCGVVQQHSADDDADGPPSSVQAPQALEP